MFTAFKMADGSSVTGCSFVGFDAAFDVTDAKDVQISDVHVSGRVAVKGSRAHRLSVADVTHSYQPNKASSVHSYQLTPTKLAIAIRRAIYGYV